MEDQSKGVVRFFSALAGKKGGWSLTVGSLSLLLLLLPVVIVPSFVDQHGAMKQFVLIVLTAVALFGWLLHLYRARAWERRAQVWIWLPLLVVLGVAVSAIASPSGFIAWVGGGGQAFTAVVPTLAVVLVFLLVVHLASAASLMRWIFSSLLLGVLVALILAVLEIVGVSLISGAHGFPGFSTTGTIESLMLLGSVLSVVTLGIWATDDHVRSDVWTPSNTWRWFFTIAGVLTILATLFLFSLANAPFALIVLLVAGGLFVGFGLHRPSKFTRPTRMLAPIILFGLGLFLLILPSPIGSRVPQEVLPSYQESVSILSQTWAQEGWMFGSGPGTYAYNYQAFKSPSTNQTIFWRVPFDHSVSHILTLLTTWGLTPVLVLLVFIGWCFWAGFHAILVRHEREDWQTVALLFSAWVGLVVGQFLYASDIVVTLTFWVISGLLVATLAPDVQRVAFARHDRISLLTSLGFVATGVLVIVAAVGSLQWLLGDAAYARATTLRQTGEDVERVFVLAKRATKLNRMHAGYARLLAALGLEVVESRTSAGEVDEAALFEVTNAAMMSARRAAILEPRDTRNHDAVRQVATSLAPAVAGMDRLALDAAIAAERTAPLNPIRDIQAAEAFLLAAAQASQVISDEEQRNTTVAALLTEAERAVNEAIATKPDLARGYYTRTLVYDAQGRLPEAIQELERVVAAVPRDPIVRFELGVAHLRSGNVLLAQQSFETALELSPTFANAKWYLSSVYESSGDIEAAMVQLQDLLILDPENRRVQEKLQLLRDGQVSDVSVEETEPLE